MWWYTCATPALGRQKQPYLYEFKDNLIYIMHSETVSQNRQGDIEGATELWGLGERVAGETSCFMGVAAQNKG